MKDYSVKTLSYSQTKFQTFESSQSQLCKEQALFYEIYICYIIVTKRNLHLLNNFHKFNVIERRLRHFLTIFHKTRISKKKKEKKYATFKITISTNSLLNEQALRRRAIVGEFSGRGREITKSNISQFTLSHHRRLLIVRKCLTKQLE